VNEAASMADFPPLLQPAAPRSNVPSEQRTNNNAPTGAGSTNRSAFRGIWSVRSRARQPDEHSQTAGDQLADPMSVTPVAESPQDQPGNSTRPHNPRLHVGPESTAPSQPTATGLELRFESIKKCRRFALLRGMEPEIAVQTLHENWPDEYNSLLRLQQRQGGN